MQEHLQADIDAFTLGRRGDVLELSNSLDGRFWLATIGDPSGQTSWESGTG